jgi:ATP-dependent 26S proteasome regulatory subunit
MLPQPDALNLAGILNVLDGILDCPERIVVMTTNHPDKIDPALIRPGRVNKKVHMGFLRWQEALQMVVHYFGLVTATEEALIRKAVEDAPVTPATLEMLCGEHDTVSELCSHLLRDP